MTAYFVFATTNLALCAWAIGTSIRDGQILWLIPIALSATAAGISLAKIMAVTP